MASTKFSRKEFERYIRIGKKIEEKISMMGTHLESLNEQEVELEILPNRPDLFSLQGFMRSFLAFIGKSKIKEYKIKKSDAKIIVDKSVEKIRPFSMAAVVKGVKFTDEKIKEIMQWQEKIHATIGRDRKKVALGYYILDKVKFPVKYLALEPSKINFEPLDMPEKMNGLQILQRHPAGRAYAKQLQNFDKFPVYIDANNGVLSMPPIINSNSSGKITPGTTDILIECSGSNPALLKKVISIAVVDLIDLGGEAYSVEITYGNKKEFIDLKAEKMKINLENVNKLLGLNLKEQEIKKLLEKMGYNYKNKQVEIPAYRTDILHEIDLIEDIAIAYGYDKFEPEIPEVATVGKENPKEKFKKKIAEILTGLGTLECSSFNLITQEDIKKQGIKKAIEVENSKTDYKFLRQDMLISSLKVLRDNIDAEYPQKIFEIGTVFQKDEKEETGIKETDKLVVSISPGNFTEIRQILEYLARMLDKKFEIKETIDERFIDGRVGKVMFRGKETGILGEISPQILKNWHLKMPAASFELDVDELMS